MKIYTTNLSDWLLACGMALTFATQLRLATWPFGPGEVVLLCWLAITAQQIWRGKEGLAWSAAKPFLLFWGVILIAMGLGWLNAAISAVPGPANRAHDAVAYVYCAALSVVFLMGYRQRDNPNLPLIWGLVLTVPLLVLWGLQQPLSGRFMGWARNPNQTALAVLLVPILVTYWNSNIRKQPSSGHLALILALAVGALFIGWETESSALKIAWAISLPFLMLGLVLTGNSVAQRRSRFRTGAALATAALVVAGVTIALQISQKSGTSAVLPGFVSRINNVIFSNDALAQTKVSIRSTLYRNAGEAIVESRLLGFGPGSFSGLKEPLQGDEAHNIVLDWGMSGGIGAMGALLALLGAIAFRLWRSGQYVVLAGVIAVMVFGQFHQVLRHPLVWIFLAYAWVEGGRGRMRQSSEATPEASMP